MTRGARLLDDHADATALWARLAEREETLVLVEHTATATTRALRRHGAGLGAGAVTGVARDVTRQVDRRGDALHRALERELQLGLEVDAALRTCGRGTLRATATAASAAVEQVAEQVAEITEVVVGEREPAGSGATEAAGHGTHTANLVVLLATFCVADHVVCRGDLLEPFLRRRRRPDSRPGGSGATACGTRS